MTPPFASASPAGLLAFVTLAITLSWIYGQRYRVTRPPIGVLNILDVVLMVVGVVLVPYLYLVLPRGLVTALLLVGTGSCVYFAAEPVLRERQALWLLTLGLLAADVGAAGRFGTASAPYYAVNNAVLIVAVLGATALWAQSGLKGRDVAILGAALAIYDLVFTWRLPLMTDLISRFASLPFVPMLVWPVGQSGKWLAIGLGDVLMAAVFPLVMRKAYGRGTGLVAMATMLAALAIVVYLPIVGRLAEAFPVMIVLGPIMVLEYGIWHHKAKTVVVVPGEIQLSGINPGRGGIDAVHLNSVNKEPRHKPAAS